MCKFAVTRFTASVPVIRHALAAPVYLYVGLNDGLLREKIQDSTPLEFRDCETACLAESISECSLGDCQSLPVMRGMKPDLLECGRLSDIEERPISLESAREE